MRKLPTIIFIVGTVIIYTFLTSPYYVGLVDQNRFGRSIVVWIAVCLLMYFAISRQNNKQ